MASEKHATGDILDERLVAARDSVLAEGEQIVAQEEGDQGQCIVLTDSRALVIKVGITATGAPNGQVIGAFPLQEITAVNVRKGPLGSVIHICVQGGEGVSEPGSAPNNVVVFTGSQRMKKCEAIAPRIEAALGKPVGRTEPKPEPIHEAVEENSSVEEIVLEAAADEAPVGDEQVSPEQPTDSVDEPKSSREAKKGGRVAMTLAEEMFAEMAQTSEAPPIVQPDQLVAPELPVVAEVPEVPEMDAVLVAIESPVEVIEAPTEPTEVVHPNPNLPKPVARSGVRDRVLVLLGSLALMLLLGLAVMRVTSGPEPTPTVDPTVTDSTQDTKALIRRQNAIDAYTARAKAITSTSERTIAVIEAALRSGGKSSIAAAVQNDGTSAAWRKLGAIKPPAGLAGAHQQLTSGLFIAKTAVANVEAAQQSPTAYSKQDILARLSEAKGLIMRGYGSIAAMRTVLKSQIDQSRAKAAKPRPKTSRHGLQGAEGVNKYHANRGGDAAVPASAPGRKGDRALHNRSGGR